MDRERIGKYRILGEIGRGTMGVVFEAFDPVLKRRVALKTISVPVSPDDEVLERFRREAQAAALLNHPNIVTIHDYGEEGKILFMAMELLQGPDLRDAIDNDILGPLTQKLDVMDSVLDALEYAHSQEVVHRDIKPANIHLGSGRQIKIMDFGLARLNTSEMTQEGIVLGTPNYMSPEQALGDKVDGRSDVFSTGAVLYELLTGHKPFEADSTPSVLFQVVHKEPPPVSRWTPGVPAPIIDIVNRALTKDRRKRFTGASEMRAALAAARRTVAAGQEVSPSSSSSGSAPPGSLRVRRPGSSSSGRRARRRRSRVPLVAAGAGLALIAALTVTALWVTSRLRAPGPKADNTQVGELTRALVATQVQLATRELDDKNWTAAEAQALSALRLSPDHPEATRTLETARVRLGELEAAINTARGNLEAGNNEAASEQLSRVLELDPRHPAAIELSARLNTVFRTQASDAAALMSQARDQAATGGAARSREFAAANATAEKAAALGASEEYADATRQFLEARDGFDRARRAAEVRRAAAVRPRPTPAPPELTARAADASGPPDAVSLSPMEPPTPVAIPEPEPTVAPTPAVAARRFLAGKTTITTPSAGALVGFESADVKMLRPPRFVGKLEFEVLPSEVRPEEPFVVRLYVVNEGRKAVRIRGLELVTIEDGHRTAAPARLLQKKVDPRVRALVAEYTSVWSPVDTWSLEAVAAVDGDELVQIRLRSE